MPMMPSWAGAAGGAGLAAGAGFPPLLLSALFSLGPGVLSRLFGGDSNQRYRDMVQRLTNPQNVGKLTGQFYNQNLSSPAYTQALGTIASGANATQGNLMRELGARGIGTSGTGAILSSLSPSIVGSQQAGLRTAAHDAATQQAWRSIQAQLQGMQQSQGPSYSGQLFGAGLDSLGPMLTAWLRAKYPGQFNFGASQ